MSYFLRHPFYWFQSKHWNIFHMYFKPKAYYQRLRYGICESDSWNLDGHLRRIIEKGCKDLMGGYSHPMEIYDDVGRVIYSNDINSGDGEVIWISVLEDIVEGMEEYEKFIEGWHDEDGEYQSYYVNSPEWLESQMKWRKALFLVAYNFTGLWD